MMLGIFLVSVSLLILGGWLAREKLFKVRSLFFGKSKPIGPNSKGPDVLNLSQQKALKGAVKGQGFVRKEDSHKLTSEEEQKKRIALDFIEQGHIMRGTEILEMIHMERLAIDILEKAQMIDEACQILIRMGRKNRAGAVCERHEKYLQAAKYYEEASLFKNAADMYYNHFMVENKEESLWKAINIYKNLEEKDMVLECYERGRKWDLICQYVAENEMWLPLYEIIKRVPAECIMKVIPRSIFKTFVNQDFFSEGNAMTWSDWCNMSLRMDLISVLLNRLLRHREILTQFWSGLRDDLRNASVQSIQKIVSKDFKNMEVRRVVLIHAHALYDAGYFELAGNLYFHIERMTMAAKCFSLSGQIDRVLECLKLSNDTHFYEEVKFIIQGKTTGWAEEEIKRVRKLLDHVDPYTEESTMSSPFSLAS